MKWLKKFPYFKEEEERVVVKFAWLPKLLSDGKAYVWLRKYKSFQVFKITLPIYIPDNWKVIKKYDLDPTDVWKVHYPYWLETKSTA